DHCPGYGSAAKYVATTMQELYEDAAVYNYPQVVIVEVMGRNAGWLTGSAALARLNGHGPDLVYLPEVPFSVGDFLNSVGDFLAIDQSVLVAVSEGVMDEDGVYITDYSAETKYIDTFGHIQMGGVGSMLKSMVINRYKAKTRSIELSLLQRCAGHIASKTDLDEAIMVGKAAVDYAIEGQSGYMVGIKRTSSDPYRSEPELLDLAKCANYENKVPQEWILPGGKGVTDEFIDYMKPLIQGEVRVPQKDGLPVFAKLEEAGTKE
ncbi:MAG: diphosphate--fructose-6-phosphate 1-phosphotransferase, partial [Eubacteriaceae bacterium]|nr:diphosphate--fructose-6-phosphate 1-phosphotransferase [Eubacteriaceae bacterium]